MAKLSKISGNSLSELQGLLSEIDREIERYSHVSHLLDRKFVFLLKAQQTEAQNERNKREDTY